MSTPLARHRQHVRIFDMVQRASNAVFSLAYLLVGCRMLLSMLNFRLVGPADTVMSFVGFLMQPFEPLAHSTLIPGGGILHWSGLFLFGVVFFVQVTFGIVIEAIRKGRYY